jgi:hypothetical protein
MLRVSESYRGAWRLTGTGSLQTALSNARLRRHGFLLPSDLGGQLTRWFQPPDAENRMSGDVDGAETQSPSRDPIRLQHSDTEPCV